MQSVGQFAAPDGDGAFGFDAFIDGGNSYYHDDIRRAAELNPKGIHHVNVGTSGGVWGSERGYCLMIGGDETVVQRLDPVFAALAPSVEAAPRTPGREKLGGTAEHGYLHCGPSGAGHFVCGVARYERPSLGSMGGTALGSLLKRVQRTVL